MRKPRVGVAGYGVIGKRLADGVALQQDMELVGVADVALTLPVRALKEKGMPHRLFCAAPEMLKTFQANGFEVALDSSLTNGDVVMLELSLKDTLLDEWSVALPLVIATPLLEVASYGTEDIVGDGDFVIEPGEEMLITVQILNTGLTYTTATASLSSIDPYLTVTDSITSSGNIDPGSFGLTRHKLVVSGGAPMPYVGVITVDMETADGADFTDSIYVNVGDFWFADDCEAGDGNWTRGGSPDLWHLSDYRAHSGTYSWHFGIDSTHVYPKNADGNIVSCPLVAGEENELRFWYWYDLTTYGSDGVYVIVHANGAADTVEFIGAGGALNNPPQEPLNIYSDWVEWSMMLPDMAPGDSLQIEFAFFSDGDDEAEGVYVDDVLFTSRIPEKTAVEDFAGEVCKGALTILPNPVSAEARILMAPSSAVAVLSIYDVEGRLVSELQRPSGARSVSWDLRDSSGRRVAPGIYLAKVKGGAYASTSKIVVLR